MNKNLLPRLDINDELRTSLEPQCRLKVGEAWTDPRGKHRVVCGDATDPAHVALLMNGQTADLAIHDPPYNMIAFQSMPVSEYIAWSEKWLKLCIANLSENASFYVWLGADQKAGFQPLPEFMILMRQFQDLKSRSFITMRNQRGYGTQKNWMAVRQELLYYTKGEPYFRVQYTDIPKILRGYYKEIDGELLENIERSHSQNIRPGNVWVDIQQVFYKMEENVAGCYAQKPLKAIDRLVLSSARESDVVVDFFAHSGTTLLSCERMNRACYTMDLDPIFCELTIRRLERFREKGLTGWQNNQPFEGVSFGASPESDSDGAE